MIVYRYVHVGEGTKSADQNQRPCVIFYGVQKLNVDCSDVIRW